jgi:hypothetical protein
MADIEFSDCSAFLVLRQTKKSVILNKNFNVINSSELIIPVICSLIPKNIKQKC